MHQPCNTASETSVRCNAQEPIAFFDAIYDAYLTAEKGAGGSQDYFYTVGGFKVRLRFAGPALVPYFIRALAHLEVEPVCEVDLTLCVWDSQSTHIPLPDCPWSPEDQQKQGVIRGFNNDRMYTVVDGGEQYALNLLDRNRNLGIYWCSDPDRIPYWVTGAPLLKLFYIWMEHQGFQLIHAGAVGFSSGGALLVGKSGSGKSTTALACLQSDLGYAGDDYCLLSFKPVLTVHSLYSTGKKNADDIRRLPELQNVISNRQRLVTEKALYFINDHYSQKILFQFSLKALLIPQITSQIETSITSASAARALVALAPSSIFQLPGAGSVAFQRMSKLVKTIPVYTLNLGSDPQLIAPVICKLLAGG